MVEKTKKNVESKRKSIDKKKKHAGGKKIKFKYYGGLGEIKIYYDSKSGNYHEEPTAENFYGKDAV